jgi:hypothetical protein
MDQYNGKKQHYKVNRKFVNNIISIRMVPVIHQCFKHQHIQQTTKEDPTTTGCTYQLQQIGILADVPDVLDRQDQCHAQHWRAVTSNQAPFHIHCFFPQQTPRLHHLIQCHPLLDGVVSYHKVRGLSWFQFCHSSCPRFFHTFFDLFFHHSFHRQWFQMWHQHFQLGCQWHSMVSHALSKLE